MDWIKKAIDPEVVKNIAKKYDVNLINLKHEKTSSLNTDHTILY